MSQFDQSITLPSGVQLKNRLMLSPMTTQLSFFNGVITEMRSLIINNVLKVLVLLLLVLQMSKISEKAGQVNSASLMMK